MLLATYGTFRKGEVLSDYLEHLRVQGTSEVIEVTGLKLFVVGMAPGAKLTGNPNDKAVIELIDADIDDEDTKETLKVLDRVEGVDFDMYKRDAIDTPKGEAIIYTKCGDISGCVEITDWMEWQKHSDEDKADAFGRSGKQGIVISGKA